MKKLLSYASVAVTIVLTSFGIGFAAPAPPPSVPEPGTMALLGSVVAGGFIARKIVKK